MTRRSLLVALATALIAAPLAACGRRGSLIPPEDATYPRRFPSIGYPSEKQPDRPSEDEDEDEPEDPR